MRSHQDAPVIRAAARLVVGCALAAAATTATPTTALACDLYTLETFPKGSVWMRITGPASDAANTSRDTALDLESELLVFGIRPDGVLVQNKQSRFPRLMPWKVLARNEISTDGRRSWQPGCSR